MALSMSAFRAAAKPLGLVARNARHSPSQIEGCGRGLIRPKAVQHPEASHFDDDTNRFNAQCLSSLQQRIAELKRTQQHKPFGYSAAALQQSVELSLESRPEVPYNLQTWQEFEQDHLLLTNWHEQSWERLRKEMNGDDL